MKNNFQSNIEGNGFFKIYIIYYITILILLILSSIVNQTRPFIAFILQIIYSLISFLLYFSLFKYSIHYIKYKNNGFTFSGKIGEYFGKVVKWYFLTIITLGIYSPWYIKGYTNYFLTNMYYNDTNLELKSRPGILLKYMLLTLYLPIILLTLILVITIVKIAMNYAYLPVDMIRVTFISCIFVFVIFIVIIPFIHFYFVWSINIKYGTSTIIFKRTLKETTGFLIGQVLLSIITFGIYYPAAIVKIYRFLTYGSSIISTNENETQRLGFDGSIQEGFKKIWGQGLLTLITIGIYAPWALSKIMNWFLNETYVDDV